MKKRHQKIIDLYLSNQSSIKIAKHLNISKKQVLRVLKLNNIERRSINIFTDIKDITNIIDLYKSNISIKKIALEKECSKNTIRRILIKNNIDIPESQKYTYDLTFFDTIDNEAKAYFLGFLYADGTNTGNGVNLELLAPDKHILETLRDIIAPNKQLEYREDKNTFKLRCFSTQISNQLIKLGCPPKKSLILKFPTPDMVPDHLISHFMRGYFDGDGTINTGNNKYYRFGVASSREFSIAYGDIIRNKLNISYTSSNHINGASGGITISGNKQIYILMSWLYQDANFFLKRKHNLFLELEKRIKYMEDLKNQRSIRNQNIIDLYLSNKSTIEIAKIFKLSKMRICQILAQFNIPIGKN
jgi:intein-encoded DNA endonuclease-like protein